MWGGRRGDERVRRPAVSKQRVLVSMKLTKQKRSIQRKWGGTRKGSLKGAV